MIPELSRLIEVQVIDKDIQEIQRALEQLPEDLKATEAALARLQDQQAAHLQQLEDLKAQRRDTETEMAEMEAGIKKSRQRLMEIKSNIEYKAMLKEIAFKEDQRDQRETRTLELMERMEEENRAIAAKEQEIQEQEAVLNQQRLVVEAETAKLREELAGLQEQCAKLHQGLPAHLLKRYDFIRQRRNGTAVAPVRGGVCMGCNMNILPQQFIDLQKGNEILQCPHCQRILYWFEDEAEAEAGSQKVS
ncbi:MAG TPA: C4-type zinc ribbon domain-containing protein [Desulfobaccales bacterium]